MPEMTEVVDLISSDSESTIRHTVSHHHHRQVNAAIRTTSTRRNLLATDFDLALDDDDEFPWPLHTKRRKRESSPPLRVRADTNSKVATCGNPGLPKRSIPLQAFPTQNIEDEIVLTSSPPQSPQPEKHGSIWTTVDSQYNSNEIQTVRAGLSSSTAALLEEIALSKSKRTRNKKGKEKLDAISDDDEPISLDGTKISKPNPKVRVDKCNNDAERQANQAQREEQRQNRAAEKEAAKQAREDARNAKAAEKQRAADIASVNRSKLDKNVTTPEMIVYFPTSMDGSSSLTQSREFLKSANSITNLYDSEIPGIIKFRRKIRADFDDAEGCFLPVQPREDDEKMIILYLLAEDFARLVSPLIPTDEILEDHLARVRNLHRNCRIIIVIEGLEKLIAKEKNAVDRAYQAAVRRTAAAEWEKEQQDATSSANSAAPTRRRQKKANDPVIVDETVLDSALLSLQVKHSIQIHHCMTPLDTGETILAMTQQLSLSRYRDPPCLTPAQLAVQPNFCMSTGQVPTGRTIEDTYLKILQQVIRVTEREATAIAKVYPSMGSLFKAFKTKGDKVLEDIMKEGGGARGVSTAERRIGPRTSERFGRILLGLDAGEMIG